MTEHHKHHADTPPIWHVKAASDPRIRVLAQKFRDVPGLWEYACGLCLWSMPLDDGTPIMDEGEALAAILTRAGDIEAPDNTVLRSHLLEAASAQDIARTLPAIGRAMMEREPWGRWRLWAGETLEPEDLDVRHFADGWMDRHRTDEEMEQAERDEDRLLLCWNENTQEEMWLPY